jgi:hypothetical protein
MSTAKPEQITTSEPRVAVRSQASTAHPKSIRSLAQIVSDRRRFRRVPIRVLGRFMREDKEEYPCQVVNMSAGGIAMLSPVQCEEGERIIAYLDHFGRIEGIVVRLFEGGVAVRIVASHDKRKKIANLLTWLINRESLGLINRDSVEVTKERHEQEHGECSATLLSRLGDRDVPVNPLSKLILPSGDVLDCRIIDVSLSGASIAIAEKPPLETEVILGRIRGRIARHHDTGVAVQFAELQDPDSISHSFGQAVAKIPF